MTLDKTPFKTGLDDFQVSFTTEEKIGIMGSQIKELQAVIRQLVKDIDMLKAAEFERQLRE